MATLSHVIAFHRSNPLNKRFMTKVDQLISAGLTRKIVDDDNKSDRLVQEQDDEAARPLTMDHLGVCFIAIITCLGLCCVVFFIECVTKRFA
jgi:hypothetical protein